MMGLDLIGSISKAEEGKERKGKGGKGERKGGEPGPFLL